VDYDQARGVLAAFERESGERDRDEGVERLLDPLDPRQALLDNTPEPPST
jgi:hypothetical protein